MPTRLKSLTVLTALTVPPAAVTVLLLTRAHQQNMPPTGGVIGGTGGISLTGRTFLALAAILALGRLAGHLVGRLGQPRVIGEMLAGIILGPSVLGLITPEGFHWLFTPDVMGAVNGLAQLGLALFMFLVGLELEPPSGRERGGAVGALALASVAVPLCGGVGVGLLAHDELGPAGVDPAVFALFIGVCMSVTAFPVLARILMERGIFHTPLGSVSMLAAAVTDVLAWLLLAVVVAAARDGSPLSILRTCLLLGAFALVMHAVLRPALTRALGASARHLPEGGALAMVVVGVLVAGAVTEVLGVHLIFGAFLFGLCCPRNAPVLEAARGKIADVTSTLLLPPFFAMVGIRTHVTDLGGRPVVWLWFVAFLLLAVVGKGGAVALAARGAGLRVSAVRLGLLLSCKGLTELVMLGLGLELGVLTEELFTLLVLVTVVTTAMTVPLLDLLDRQDRRTRPGRRASAPAPVTSSQVVRE